MGATGIFIHACHVDISAFKASLHIHDQLLHCLYVNLSESMHKDASLWVLPDLQVRANLCIQRGGRGVADG